VASAVVVYVVSRRLGDARDPTPHRVALSAVAGGVWPLLVLGAAEFSSWAACCNAAAHLEPVPELVGAGVVPLR
jgi:hypothetical protein